VHGKYREASKEARLTNQNARLAEEELEKLRLARGGGGAAPAPPPPPPPPPPRRHQPPGAGMPSQPAVYFSMGATGV